MKREPFELRKNKEKTVIPKDSSQEHGQATFPLMREEGGGGVGERVRDWV